MKKKNISDALNNIDFDMVEDVYESTKEKKKKQKSLWLKWGAFAACFLFVITLTFPFIHFSQDKLPTEDMQIIEYNNSYYEVCDDESALKKFGIEKTITEKSAGEIITYLTKKHLGGKSQYVATEEKTTLKVLNKHLLCVRDFT